MVEELEQAYSGFATRFATCGSIFDPSKSRTELDAIEKLTADPSIWSNPERSQTLMRERKRLESALNTEADLARRVGDIDAYFELAP